MNYNATSIEVLSAQLPSLARILNNQAKQSKMVQSEFGTESAFDAVIDSGILISCVSNRWNVLVTSSGGVQREHSEQPKRTQECSD